MNKDAILAKSREENKNRDLYVEQVTANANSVSSLVTLLFATTLFLIQSFVKNEFNYGLYAIVLCSSTVVFTVRAIRLKRKRDILFAVLFTLATLIFTALFVLSLFVTPEM